MSPKTIPNYIINRIIQEAKSLYEGKRLISVRVLKVKERNMLMQDEIFIRYGLFINEETWYLLLVENIKTLKITRFSRDCEKLGNMVIKNNLDLMKLLSILFLWYMSYPMILK